MNKGKKMIAIKKNTKEPKIANTLSKTKKTGKNRKGYKEQ